MPKPRRVDPLRRLYSRRQLSRAQYLAARALERAGDQSEAADVIRERVGQDGFDLVCAVLAGRTLTDIAHESGCGVRERYAHSWLFRRALDALALRLGLVHTRR
jgi:hypothetical protein